MKITYCNVVLFLFVAYLSAITTIVDSFSASSYRKKKVAPSSAWTKDKSQVSSKSHDRRRFLFQLLRSGFLSTAIVRFDPALAATSLQDLVLQINEARNQLEPVPQLIKDEKWDAIRAILITPPLSDCWAKTNKPLLINYAEAVGNEVPEGDELAALELKEDIYLHLRFLDMSVYNNNFNPIKTEGESGATKELVKSYYEDPVREYKASKKALDELVSLSATVRPLPNGLSTK